MISFMLLIGILGVTISFILFTYASDYFVDGLGILGKKLNVPGSVIGATVAAIGSSAPEMGTSVFSVIEGRPEIGIGTIVGSAIFNITVIVGASALVRRCYLSKDVLYRDGLFYLFALAITIIFISDGELTRFEALIWVFSYLFYLVWLLRDAKQGKYEYLERKVAREKNMALYLIGGLLVIIFVADILIRSTIAITDELGISGALFGLIIIAIGTSVPDLFTSIQAARKGMGSLAISNAIGSNIFDICAALGIPLSFIAMTEIHEDITISVPYLIGTLVLTLLLIKVRKYLSRKEGAILISTYALFVIVILLREFKLLSV